MKKIISLLLAVIILVSSFAVCSVSVGATEEKSYKDQMIDAVLNNQSLWYSRSLSLFGMSTGYGHTEFLDLDFDGNLEFVVTYPGGTMGDIFRDVYYL